MTYRRFVRGEAMPDDPFLRFIRAWNNAEKAKTQREKTEWFVVALNAFLEVENA